MAIKTFSAGETLTASDTNTYLNNGGLVYITSTTVGNGVTVTNVNNCFSSTYDNYRVLWTGGTISALALIYVYMGNAVGTGYYGSRTATFVNGTAALIGDNNGTLWQYANAGDATFAQCVFDFYNPYASKPTFFESMYQEPNGANSVFGRYTGFHNSNTSYTGFTIDPQGAVTMTGGTITVYGYRKA